MKLAQFILVVIFTQIVFAGGDLVNNGGGIAEKNVMFAYQKLGSYIQLCLNSDFCKIDSEQRGILQKIAQGLPQEQQVLGQVQFASERNQNGFFIIDREVKVAKTGSRIGSPIYINLDLIYTKNELGYYIPMSVGEAVAVLIHELGHHYGDYTHTDLDLLGVRVAMMLQYKTYTSPLLPWSQQISSIVINPAEVEAFPDMLLYVDNQVVDLSERLKGQVFCPEFTIPIPILPVPDITLKKSHARGALVHNVHWEKVDDKKTDKTELRLVGDLSLQCKDQKDIVFRSQDFKLQLDFSVSKDATDRWILDESSIKLDQTRDHWWKIIKIGSN